MDPQESNPTEGLGKEGQADAIASLLVGEDEKSQQVEEQEEVEVEEGESSDEETPSEDSSQDEEESDEVEQPEEEESDPSWEGVLGIKEDQLSFDDDGNIKGVQVKVNGETSTVSLNDLIRGYQTDKAVTLKSQAFAEERKEFEARTQEVVQEYKSKLENAEILTDFLSKQMKSEFENLDWDRLRQENPAEYAAARQDYALRTQMLQEAQEAIIEEKKINQETEYKKFVEQRNVFLKAQRDKMLANNPSWNDQEKFNNDMKEIKTFLSNQYGFTDQDFAQVADARLIELVKDAKAFRQGQSTVKKQIKKPVPKFMKSSGTKPQPVSKLQKLTKAAKNAKGASKRNLQSEAIAELLMGEK